MRTNCLARAFAPAEISGRFHAASGAFIEIAVLLQPALMGLDGKSPDEA
jgi:hypothetical protein